MPAAELALRWQLFQMMAGTGEAAVPAPANLSAVGINIGLIVAEQNNKSFEGARNLASQLGLQDVGDIDGKLTYWRGTCSPKA